LAFDEQIIVGREELTLEPERTVLVGIEDYSGASQSAMQELLQLVRAAGASVVDVITQTRSKPHRATYVGKGKLEEIREAIKANEADMVVFNATLKPAQINNILDVLEEWKVLDRVELILDVFAQHARSREGKLQVELARLTYLLPRLVGHGKMMSRIGGGRVLGIGVRGPGETKLETDRRQLRHRITQVRRELEEVASRRDTEREARRRSGLPTISIVGYTNAGKSSLLNALAGSHEVEAHDRLFETLDPTTRRVDLGDGVRALASDTVGFLRNLPPNLIAAFRSTLEEAVQADIIVEVVDASAPEALEQHRASQEILGELEALDKPYVAGLNKWDLVEDHEATWQRLKRLPKAVPLSATSGMGLEELRECLRELVRNRRSAATIRLPYDHLDLLDMIHQRGHVLSQEYQSDYVEAQIEVDSEILGKLERFWPKADCEAA